MRILIVEDDRLLAAGLAMMVENAGHEVVGHAATVRAAMDLARAQSPDLTLMDIDLGLGGSGIAAARGMKKHHGLVSLFVSEHPERARQASDAALGVLVKPYGQDAVRHTLRVASQLLAGQQASAGDLPAGLELFFNDSKTDPVSAGIPVAGATIEMGR
jgi:two-component system, response regulator PdtaR